VSRAEIRIPSANVPVSSLLNFFRLFAALTFGDGSILPLILLFFIPSPPVFLFLLLLFLLLHFLLLAASAFDKVVVDIDVVVVEAD